MSEISHANQIRGAQFKLLLGKLWIWLLILGLAAAAGVAAGLFWMPLGGAIAAVAVLVVGLVCVFAYADHQAEEAFFDAYASSRGLTRSQTQVGGLTPLLEKGDSRRIEEMFTGQLNDEFTGSLALYTFSEKSRDSDGDETEVKYPYTLVLIDLPECVERLPELLIQRRSGLKSLEKLEDAFRGNHERVTLESEAMRDRYEIFVNKQQDPVFVRRVFSPSFIVWLAETPPKNFAFELRGGHLVAYVPKHRDDVAGFDEMIAVGTAVAKRLRDEATE